VIGRRTSNIFSPVEGLYRISSVTADFHGGKLARSRNCGGCALENPGRPGLESSPYTMRELERRDSRAGELPVLKVLYTSTIASGLLLNQFQKRSEAYASECGKVTKRRWPLIYTACPFRYWNLAYNCCTTCKRLWQLRW
jgi:hypothetical protein